MNKVESIDTLLLKDYMIIRLGYKILEMSKNGYNEEELERVKKQLNTRLEGTGISIDEVLTSLSNKRSKNIGRGERE